MKRIRIVLKNYRGFADADPVRFEIDSGFTALVGKNNSGKSAAKLFFYEFRQLLDVMANIANNSPALADLFVPSWRFQMNPKGVSDIQEVFCNTNARPMTVEIEVLQPETQVQKPPPTDCLARIVATCDRSQPSLWSFAAFGTRNPVVNLSIMAGRPGEERPGTLILPSGQIDITEFSAAAGVLAGARYYGPFRNAINQGAAEHFDLQVGTAFVNLWNEWKTGGMRAQSRAIDDVTEDIKRLFEFDRLEINASVKLSTLMVGINGHSYRLNELGSGLAQFIMVLGNAATTRPSLLLIDEPETNLHPALQIDFLLAVARYATHGVLFSTHSIGLARSVADRIYSVQKQGDKTLVKPYEATPNYLEFVGELSFSTFKDLGSDRLLLVEGVNDVKAVQQLLRLVKKEHTTVILPLGGDQLAAAGREAELHELTRLSANISALVDSEREVADAPPHPKRIQFAETCGRCGITVCVTDRRAIENYFTDRAVKAALGDDFSALHPNERLSTSARPWSKGDNWKIARQMHLEELAGTDVGRFLDQL
jgi:energy-coupling factor transporter ATP-binding protein EcfA2